MYDRGRNHERRRRSPITLSDFGTPSVVTILEPALRRLIDNASDESFRRVHLDTPAGATRAIREERATALLLSPQVMDGDVLAAITNAVRLNPVVTPIVVLTEQAPTPAGTLLKFGARGIREVVNLAEREGWRRLRGLIRDSGGQCASLLADEVLSAASSASTEMRQFLGTIVRVAPSTTTVQSLAGVVGIHPNTLMSRFFRAALPPPKLYLCMTRLLYAAWLLEKPGISIAATADALHFSSPQSFGRHLRCVLGLTAGEFRREVPLRVALDHYAIRLIRPHLERLATFRPLPIEA